MSDRNLVRLTADGGSPLYLDPRTVVGIRMGGTGITVIDTNTAVSMLLVAGSVDQVATALGLTAPAEVNATPEVSQ